MLASAFTLILAASSALALPHGISSRQEDEIARPGNATFQLSKRFSDARWTFFDPGLGACGGTNSGSDFIVALNIEQWAGGSHCYQEITMSYGGKTTSAQIVDECPGCPYGGLDLSPSLFSFFASQDLGVIQGTWNFGGSSGGSSGNSGSGSGSDPTTTKKQPAPTTTSTHTDPTTTKAAPPPPAPTTSSTTSTSTTSTSVSSVSSAAPTPSTLPGGIASSPLFTTVQDPDANGTLAQVFDAIVQLGLLVNKS